ncbi:MAG: GDSL-type esterase/lipase family protein [Leptospirillia bacterium]
MANDSALKHGVRVAALGDSITWGFPGGPMTSWVQRTTDRLGVEITNLGVNGETLRDMRNRVGQVIALRPYACIVMGGTNDVGLGRQVEHMAQDLVAIVEALTAAGVQPMIGMPIPFLAEVPERELSGFRHFIQSFAGTRRIRVIPFDRAFRDPSGAIIARYFMDALHPSLEGYQAMSDLLVESGALTRIGEGTGD